MDPRIQKHAEPEKSSADLIVEWLNEAQINSNDAIKVQNLCKAQEIVVNKEPHLLNAYLDEILQFAVDRSSEVRKTIAAFIEDAGKKYPAVIPRVTSILLRLIADKLPVVSKRAVRTSGRILRTALKWAASAPVVTPEMEIAWTQINTIKIQIMNMIDSDNDGIRTQAVKFLEGVVLIQTYPDPDTPQKPDDFSLEDVPLTLKMARRRKLKEEANHVMDLLIKFFGSPYVSSVNLMTCMGSLSLIAKSRPQFMPGVIQAMHKLQNDLPPTLSVSQITSVEKQLKRTLLGLMKHPASIEYATMLARQLNQLGVKEQEILKVYAKPENIRRAKKRQQETASAIAAKRAKVEPIEAARGSTSSCTPSKITGSC